MSIIFEKDYNFNIRILWVFRRGNMLKIKKNHVVIVISIIILVAGAMYIFRSQKKEEISEKKDHFSANVNGNAEIDEIEIKDFLIKADNFVRGNIFKHTGEGNAFPLRYDNYSSRRIIGCINGGYIVANKNQQRAKSVYEDYLIMLRKYYSSDYLAIEELVRYGIFNIHGRIGYMSSLECGQARSYIDESSKIEILRVEELESKQRLITCMVEKKSYLEGKENSKVYEYKIKEMGWKNYIIVGNSMETTNWKVVKRLDAVCTEGNEYEIGHGVKHMMDDGYSTYWMGKKEGFSEPESFKIEFKDEVSINYIDIESGKNEDGDFASIKRIKIENEFGEKIECEVRGNWNRIALSQLSDSKYITITVLEVENQDEAKPLAISGIYIFGRE